MLSRVAASVFPVVIIAGVIAAVALSGAASPAAPPAPPAPPAPWYRVATDPANNFGHVCITGGVDDNGRPGSWATPGATAELDRAIRGGAVIADDGVQVTVTAYTGDVATFFRGGAACLAFLASQKAEQDRYK